MRRYTIIGSLFAVMLMAASEHALAEVTQNARCSIAGTVQWTAFVNEFKRALANDDLDWIADRVEYPLRTNGEESQRKITTRLDLQERFHSIFTPNIKAIVANEDPDKTICPGWHGPFIGQYRNVVIRHAVDQCRNEGQELVCFWIAAVFE
jgi:hypothetical protein